MGFALAVAVPLGLALLLAIPVDVAFRFRVVDALAGEVTARWLFGLMRVHVSAPEPGRPRAPKRRRKTVAAGRRRRQRGGGGARALAMLGQPAFRRRLLRLIGDLVRATRPRELRVRARLGLGDPADTGRLWAVVGPLSAAARSLRDADVSIEPEFIEPALELDVRGRVRLVPLRLLGLAIAFALSPPSIRAWRSLSQGHA